MDDAIAAQGNDRLIALKCGICCQLHGMQRGRGGNAIHRHTRLLKHTRGMRAGSRPLPVLGGGVHDEQRVSQAICHTPQYNTARQGRAPNAFACNVKK